MKVLLINGSPRMGGNTSIALGEMEKILPAGGHPGGDSPGGQQGHPRLRGMSLLHGEGQVRV